MFRNRRKVGERTWVGRGSLEVERKIGREGEKVGRNGERKKMWRGGGEREGEVRVRGRKKRQREGRNIQ